MTRPTNIFTTRPEHHDVIDDDDIGGDDDVVNDDDIVVNNDDSWGTRPGQRPVAPHGADFHADTILWRERILNNVVRKFFQSWNIIVGEMVNL